MDADLAYAMADRREQALFERHHRTIDLGDGIIIKYHELWNKYVVNKIFGGYGDRVGEKINIYHHGQSISEQKLEKLLEGQRWDAQQKGKDLQKILDAIQGLNKQNKQLDAEIQRSGEKLAKILQDIKNNEEQIKKLKLALNEQSKIIKQLNQANSNLQDTIDILKNQSKDLEQKRANFQEIAREQNKKNQQKEKAIEKLCELNNKLEQQIFENPDIDFTASEELCQLTAQENNKEIEEIPLTLETLNMSLLGEFAQQE